MTTEEIEKVLEAQLELLSERSKTAPDPILIELNRQSLATSGFLVRLKKRSKKVTETAQQEA